MHRKRHKKGFGTGQSYWQSYSDMMAALLLMFVLIMASTLSQSLNLYEEKMRVQDEQIRIQEEQMRIQEEQKKILNSQQKEINEIIGIKMDIIQALSKAFQDSNLKIEIDAQTGAITLDSSVLFANNSSSLTKEGISFLDDFLPLYLSVLMSEDYRPHISEIIIEGHADTAGKYMHNLNLSQRRAYSVAEYCLSGQHDLFPQDELDDLRAVMTANGRSFSNPIYDENGNVDREKSRRVEIKFRLQDSEMIERLQEILEGT